MKFKFTLLIASLMIISIAALGCQKEKTPPDVPDDPSENTFSVLEYDDFKAEAFTFLTITNYMSLIGADLTYSDNSKMVKASLDMATPEDVMLYVDYEKDKSKFEIHLGGGRLYCSVDSDGSVKKDSMKFDNSLDKIMKELRGGGEGLTDAFEFLFSGLMEEIGASDMTLDTEAIENFLSKCTILYRGGDVDEYRIYANCGDGDKVYESSLAEKVCIEFKVNGECIIDLDGSILRGSNEIKFTFDRRTNSSPMIILPEEEYEGDLLDDFEELYNNRNVTMKDFSGEWSNEQVTLLIGEEIKLIGSDGEIVLTVDTIISNYLTLVSDDEVYVAHLTGDLELIMPDGETLILKKAYKEQAK